ncbi:MAG: rhomboid family intramembrane serine protease [Acidobacteriia bacterium]|jgi:membrane associated rhomboid family serine protease|nr:rhomboid family intramembrane serine protease [Terriglobia bacterium]
MIPLRDINPSRSTPVVTLALIVVNTVVFLYQLSLERTAQLALLNGLGFVPARLPLALRSPEMSFVDALLPLWTSMFLHGGFLHLLGNMWFLWVFGDNVEDRLGHLRFLVFYLLCGAGAGVTHALVELQSTVPTVGASGAVSGVLGAYFVLFPRSRVITLVPLVFVFLTVRLPAMVVLGYWFLIQFFSGLGTLGGDQTAGVAWWAHIGGFVFGMLLLRGVRRPTAG